MYCNPKINQHINLSKHKSERLVYLPFLVTTGSFMKGLWFNAPFVLTQCRLNKNKVSWHAIELHIKNLLSSALNSQILYFDKKVIIWHAIDLYIKKILTLRSCASFTVDFHSNQSKLVFNALMVIAVSLSTWATQFFNGLVACHICWNLQVIQASFRTKL